MRDRSPVTKAAALPERSRMRMPDWRAVAGATPDPRIVVCLLLVLALFLRAGFFFNPDYHTDEQFYFVVADRMWQGDIPFVDIWDRKPLGLFLLYAALRPFSGDTLIAVQLAGWLAVTATGYIVYRIALRFVTAWYAVLAGVLYLTWIVPFGGANGQPGVFFNLLTAASAALMLRLCADPRPILRYGNVIMAMVGIAIQLKYTPVFEGLFFGLFLIYLSWKTETPTRQIVGRSAIWIGLALAPTAAVFGFYLAIGEVEALIHANIVSTLIRSTLEDWYRTELIRYIALQIAPLAIVAAAGLYAHLRSKRTTLVKSFLVGWLIAALIGFACIGNFYDSYALPLIAPFIVLAIAFVARPGAIPLAIGMMLLVYPGIPSTYWLLETTQKSQSVIEGLSKKAEPFLAHGCMYIYDGPSILYTTTQSCIPTRFSYPDHLSNSVEENALGIDSGAEMQRIVDSRPAVIVTTSRRLVPKFNPATFGILERSLAADYVRIAEPVDGWKVRKYYLHARRDLVALQQAGKLNNTRQDHVAFTN